MTDTQNTDPPFLPPADLNTAHTLKPRAASPGPPLALDDIVHDMRLSLLAGAEAGPETETALATQACLINMAFNRLMLCGLQQSYVDQAAIDSALCAQRRYCQTLDALRTQRLRRKAEAEKSGKRTEQNPDSLDHKTNPWDLIA